VISDTDAKSVALEEALGNVILLSDLYARGIQRGADYIQRLHPAMTAQHAVSIMLGEELEKMETLENRISALTEAFPELFRLEYYGETK
jgi:hypothetical protein